MSPRLYLDPYDTFLIRDGRPFNQDDAGQGRAASLFPPPPDTVYGAVRVAIARALGWDGAGDWSRVAGVMDAVGTWQDENAALRIAGPFFEVGEFGAGGDQLLPFPAHCVVKVDRETGWPKEIGCLKPSGQPLLTDAGRIRLLEAPQHNSALKTETLAGRWGPQAVVKALLRGQTVKVEDCRKITLPQWADELPEKTLRRLPGLSSSDLARIESRVGLARNSLTRLAEDGMLYATARRQMAPGVRIYVEIEGVDLTGMMMPPAVPFGGEGRFAYPQWVAGDGTTAPGKGHGRYLICLTTPAIFKSLPEAGKDVADLPGTCVTLALTGVATIGGLVRTSTDKREQVAGCAVLPAGTVIFMEAGDGTELPASLGERSHRGYGRFLQGVW